MMETLSFSSFQDNSYDVLSEFFNSIFFLFSISVWDYNLKFHHNIRFRYPGNTLILVQFGCSWLVYYQLGLSVLDKRVLWLCVSLMQ